MREETLYYNGEWQKAQSTDYTDVINPTTEETIGKVVNANQQDVDLAVTSAKTAFSEWNQTNPETRADYMEKFLNGIKDRKQDLMDIMIKELGTSSIFADQTQVGLAVKEMSATIEEIRKYNFEETVDNATIIKEGFGVVACITPWNYPLNQIQRKITPALLAGNTVVVKPANMTPLTALLLAEIADEAGLPKGVFNIVTGPGSETGDYLTSHPDVSVISFTGSTKVGSSLYEKAKTTIKKLVLELGGKSPMVYLKGGDLELAVKNAANTVLHNQGQTCSALTRLFVPKDELERTKEVLKNYYKDIKVGDPAEEDTIVGPLVSKDQMETVLGYIEKGKEEGAEVLIGGNKMDRKGYYVEPTVFVNVKNDMTIAQEEIFGPVLVVITYDNVDEAIELANDSIYGLSGGVVGPEEEAVKVARQIRTGNITINDAARSPKAPFGGYKQSGFGRENGLYGVEDYFEIKAIFN
ncbi:aldehyde dehydrogenase family protein [Marinilactibacillus psychrotolerans]|uniref:aldehyde dehydrogenase (NAD(+)) n=1 Tax=Marinilactibacillus psychrotolerans TaxID=191770 RepID=A0AAV3WQP2_9LACT|nr:aldehyde dehydrogenase family protein [Marinilactibacillus psychrotolerans]GEL65891.1 putative aldehyde dehydrogenase [Marinilactibacillus psychrotolerans]GEQ34833.1 succinate-semialdehyde dehydrogenase [Marinilactibacillus psychrotolerans]SDC08860.1 aldehyde dehydrogenase (NAD+) [Marinilactibacillus psychrotolerans]